ncbi:hypothetical protein Q8A73_012542 [Channa argus]|nr:hypothetical protein Q8A73_012542 [Channa argus]
MPQNTTTPAALSTNFSFSHTPRSSGRGVGLDFSSMTPGSFLDSTTQQSVFSGISLDRITARIAVQVIVIYRPPGQLENFCDELDMLLSHFPEEANPLIVMGDLNIHLDKPHAADVFALLNTFDLSLVSTPSTHKAGNNLDLILTRNCTTDNILVTDLHVSDHFFVQLTVFIPRPSHSPPTLVTFRCNLKSLNPARFSSLVSATLPPTQDLSICDSDTATDGLCNTLTSCLDCLCPMSLRPARLSPSNPWLTDGIREQRTTLRGAERKWRKSKTPSALAEYQNLLGRFPHSVTRAKINYYQEKLSNTSDTRKLFSTFKSLIYPPSPSPSTSVAPALMPGIIQVINTSLKTGTFPTSFKQALITRLLKKPSLDPSVVENYRLVSLLPFLAKTMEGAVFNQLSDFLSKNNLLDVNQSDSQELTVRPGDDVPLHCRGPRDGDVVMLSWIRPDLRSEGFVFFVREKRSYEKYQLPSFHGRVELRDPEMKDGDFTVILKNVSVDDAGTYECHVGKSNTGSSKTHTPEHMSIVYLKVEDSGEFSVS